MTDAYLLTLAAMPYGLALLAGTIPLISVRFVSGRYLDAARDVWLLALAWIGAALTLLWVSVPLGLMAIAVLLWWRSWESLPAVLTWAGIIATWAIVQALPDMAFALLPIGWRIATLGLLVFAFVQRWNGFEVKATTGSRVLLAALLVLVWPFTHPIEWPAYAVGFWLTSSWIALGALLVAIALRYPVMVPWLAGFAALVVVCFLVTPLRLAIIDRTPRGGSLDGLRNRWRTAKATVSLTWETHRVVFGWGPMLASRMHPSLARSLASESVRRQVHLDTSPIHCEPLELACTYGLLGMTAMSIFAWQLWGRVTFGDPWSASAVAGIVLSLATIPARAVSVGGVWLIVLAGVMR